MGLLLKLEADVAYHCMYKLFSHYYFLYSYNIDQHDYSVRMRAAQKFLKDGDKVGCLNFLRTAFLY